MRRVLHAALVAAVAISSLALIDALAIAGWHRPAGYAAVGVVLVRLAIARMRVAMALLRVLVVVALAVSGWLYTTDMFWGSELVETVHRMLAWALLALVVEHVARAAATRARRRMRAMR